MKEKKNCVTAYLTLELKKKLQERVEELGISETAYLNLIIRKDLKEKLI